MAITLKQSAQNSTNNGSSVTVTLGSATTAGNCIVVAVGIGANDTVTGITLGGSAGNFASLAGTDGSTTTQAGWIWADPNCAGGQTSVIVTPSGTARILASVFEFSGVATVSPLDKSSSNAPGSSMNWTSNSTATTAQAVEAWVGLVITGASTITGPASPWANLAQQSAGTKIVNAMMAGSQITSSTGAAVYSGTQTANDQYTAVVVTLKPAVVSSPLSTLLIASFPL